MSRRGHLGLIGLFGVLGLWLHATERMPAWDAISLFEPYVTLLADFARSGSLLLWNPWSNGGTPDAAYVEMGSFSPVAIGIALVTGGGRGGFLVYWLFSWAFGALGVLQLARYWQVPAWAAFAVAVGFALNGFYLGHGSHLSWIHAFSFLPWALWRFEVALDEGRWLPAAQGGALWGLGALAGHPALVILNGLFVGAWCLLRLRSHGRHALVALALFTVAGLCVLSPAYVTFFVEGGGYSDRGSLTRETAVAEQSLEPLDLAGWTSPYLATLKLGDDERWEGLFVGVTDSYLPPVIVVLALVALVRRRAIGLWLIAALFMLAALGEHTPVRGWLYDLLPPTRYFRHTGVFRAQALFALTLAALLALRGNAFDRRKLRLTTIAGAAFAVASFAFVLQQFGGGERAGIAWLHLALVWGLLIAAAHTRLRFAGALLVLALLADAVLTIDLAAPQFLAVVPEAEEIAPRRSELEPVDWMRTRYPPGPYAPNDHLAGKVAVLEAFNQLNHRFHSRQSLLALESSWSDEPRLAAAAMGRARTWFSADTATVVGSDGCFLRFVQRARQLPRPPLVLQDAPSPPAGVSGDCPAVNRLPGVVELPVRVVSYSPRGLELELTAPADGWLWVTERWAPGWRVRVDGEPREVKIANFLWRGVRLERGARRVRFDYRPWGHPWWLLLSWSTLIFVAGAGFVGTLKGRGREHGRS